MVLTLISDIELTVLTLVVDIAFIIDIVFIMLTLFQGGRFLFLSRTNIN